MNTINAQKISAIRRDRQRLGVLYGLLAGTGFALSAWAIDASQLAEAHAYLPWSKFAAGWIAALILGGLAGWLTARLNTALAAGIIWAAVGSLLTLATGWLAYQGILRLFDQFYPEIASQLDYSLNPAIEIRTWIAVVVSGLIGIAVGIVELNQVDSALAGANPFQRLASLSLGLVVFGFAGLVANNLILSNLRQPVITVNNALVYAQDHRGQTLEIHEARQHGQTALRALGELQYQPYRLYVSSFDEYLSMIWVTLDFGEVQTRCSVLEKTLSYCETPPGIKPENPGEQPSSSTGALTTTPSSGVQTVEPASPTSSPAGSVDPAADPAILPDQAGAIPADLNRYQLQVSIEPDELRFQGALNLAYINTETTALDSLYFRLLPNGQRSYGNGSLNITSVEVAGVSQPLQLSQEDTVLQVSLGKNLEPGGVAQINLSFEGQVPQDFGGGENASGYGIYNSTDEVMALASWYPILAVYDEQGWHLDPVSYMGDSVFSDIASYTVEILLPPDQVLVSTGVTQQSGPVGNRQQYLLESGPARDFFIITSPHFASLQGQAGGTRINSYYLPGHESGGQRALEIAIQAVESFNHRFGVYPYTELDVVDAPMKNAAGVEYPGIFLVGSSQYADYMEPGFALTTAHEVAHQWWYNLVGNDVFAEPWLDEALASYTSGLYLEAAQGKPGVNGLMSYYRDRYQRSLDSGGDHPISGSLAYFENSASPNAYGGIVYAKGALFFDAVRQEIGDEAFFGALHSYFETYRYRIAAGKDLLAAFETAAGYPLDELYQTWNIDPPP